MNERVTSTIGELEAFMRDKDDALAIPRDAAEFVHATLLACGAKSGVEIGTSYGYSGLWAGAAIAENGGRLITIDQDPAKHEVASRFFGQAGLDGVIRCETGRAMDVLRRMEGPIDYVLNDADKENCIGYVEILLDRLSPRAVVLTDNTLSHPDQLVAFCDWIRAQDDFVSVHIPIGNGMEMSVFAADT